MLGHRGGGEIRGNNSEDRVWGKKNAAGIGNFAGERGWRYHVRGSECGGYSSQYEVLYCIVWGTGNDITTVRTCSDFLHSQQL